MGRPRRFLRAQSQDSYHSEERDSKVINSGNGGIAFQQSGNCKKDPFIGLNNAESRLWDQWLFRDILDQATPPQFQLVKLLVHDG
jgi:hypothetical protein